MTFGAFWSENALSGILVVQKRPERHSGAFWSHSNFELCLCEILR